MNNKNQLKIRKNTKNNKAITLVALVVTIIVLIILAAISINLLLGNEGLLKKTSDGRNNYLVSANEESAELADGEEIIDSSINDEDSNKGKSGYEGGSYDDPYVPEGFNHIGRENWNHGYTIQDSLGNQFVWVPCSTEETPPSGVVKFQKTLPASNSSSDPYYMYNKDNVILHPSGSTNPDVTIEDKSVAAIRTSVGTYGGFYIAKYEAGCPLDSNNNEIVPVNSSTISDFTKKARSVANANPWSNISRDNSLRAASNMIKNSNVTSCLISGECWDTTLAWITLTADSTFATNSVGKGWYSNVSGNKIHLTGYYGTNTNNIFDLAGNMYEWTTENCKTSASQAALYRGGAYYTTGSGDPAAYRYRNGQGTSNNGNGFRVVLYK